MDVLICNGSDQLCGADRMTSCLMIELQTDCACCMSRVPSNAGTISSGRQKVGNLSDVSKPTCTPFLSQPTVLTLSGLILSGFGVQASLTQKDCSNGGIKQLG